VLTAGHYNTAAELNIATTGKTLSDFEMNFLEFSTVIAFTL